MSYTPTVSRLGFFTSRNYLTIAHDILKMYVAKQAHTNSSRSVMTQSSLSVPAKLTTQLPKCPRLTVLDYYEVRPISSRIPPSSLSFIPPSLLGGGSSTSMLRAAARLAYMQSQFWGRLLAASCTTMNSSAPYLFIVIIEQHNGDTLDICSRVCSPHPTDYGPLSSK